MKINLLIDDKEKTFSIPFVPARKLREALALRKETNFSDIDPEGLDKMVAYVVDLYKNQFTIDDVYDGIASSELIPTITDTIGEVINGKQSQKNE